MKECCDPDAQIKWAPCIVCERLFTEANLDLELCEECLDALRYNPQYTGFKKVKIEQMLKYVDFKDKELSDVVRLIWEDLKGEQKT